MSDQTKLRTAGDVLLNPAIASAVLGAMLCLVTKWAFSHLVVSITWRLL